MWSHPVSVLLKKSGGAQTIASSASAGARLSVLIRNVGEGNAEISAMVGSNNPTAATLEPHSARLVVQEIGVITAKCTSADTYTVLLVQYHVHGTDHPNPAPPHA